MEMTWKIGEQIGNHKDRMDVCVAVAGILKAHKINYILY